MSGTATERMAKAVEAFGKDLGGFRTGRASASLVERVTVEHYGAITPLNQMAGISVPENTLLVIQPWDRSAIPAIEKALNNAQLGMTPAVDGGVIRLRVPAMTEERRKDLVKQMGKRAEEARVEIRNVRRDEQEAVKKAEKAKEIGEDDARRQLEALQKLTDGRIAEIDKLTAAKEREVLEG
ncbi:MAG: ribosome recycling factor [Chloroflexi bacterium]|jgi:ribosome recycling factor|nr:ribosome recycling factor [Chloroflexota bacterium]MBJ7482446.1 ribosome recycling factor [Chloroflexota bacterium]